MPRSGGRNPFPEAVVREEGESVVQTKAEAESTIPELPCTRGSPGLLGPNISSAKIVVVGNATHHSPMADAGTISVSNVRQSDDLKM